MADEVSLLKNSHFSSGYAAGKSLLETENKRLRDVLQAIALSEFQDTHAIMAREALED